MTNTMLVVVVVAVILAAAAILVYLARRRAKLKARFGAEYDRAVHDAGSARRADAALEARARRVVKYDIHPLRQEARLEFSNRWRDLQARFVDDPAAAVADADALVTQVMTARGYPMTEFDQRAEDLSVDHSNVVHHYRKAHAIALLHAGQGASTEDLRQAVVHYRALFEDLLAEHEPQRRTA